MMVVMVEPPQLAAAVCVLAEQRLQPCGRALQSPEQHAAVIGSQLQCINTNSITQYGRVQSYIIPLYVINVLLYIKSLIFAVVRELTRARRPRHGIMMDGYGVHPPRRCPRAPAEARRPAA